MKIPSNSKFSFPIKSFSWKALDFEELWHLNIGCSRPFSQLSIYTLWTLTQSGSGRSSWQNLTVYNSVITDYQALTMLWMPDMQTSIHTSSSSIKFKSPKYTNKFVPTKIRNNFPPALSPPPIPPPPIFVIIPPYQSYVLFMSFMTMVQNLGYHIKWSLCIFRHGLNWLMDVYENVSPSVSMDSHRCYLPIVRTYKACS